MSPRSFLAPVSLLLLLLLSVPAMGQPQQGQQPAASSSCDAADSRCEAEADLALARSLLSQSRADQRLSAVCRFDQKTTLLFDESK